MKSKYNSTKSQLNENHTSFDSISGIRLNSISPISRRDTNLSKTFNGFSNLNSVLFGNNKVKILIKKNRKICMEAYQNLT